MNLRLLQRGELRTFNIELPTSNAIGRSALDVDRSEFDRFMESFDEFRNRGVKVGRDASTAPPTRTRKMSQVGHVTGT